ncbi:MAG: hypothetical protein NWQ19_11050 [Nonlabens sp.]|nr:hypothetical protein [Nonlabens sp.]
MKVLAFEFGDFELFPDVIIGKMKHGIHYNLECNQELVSSILNHYGTDHILAYISIRENDYSVDPMVYLHNKLYNNLACIGIVENNTSKLSTVHVESKFFKKDKLKGFKNQNEAQIWANQLITELVEDNLSGAIN